MMLLTTVTRSIGTWYPVLGIGCTTSTGRTEGHKDTHQVHGTHTCTSTYMSCTTCF
jgi:hypothetical protein